MVASTGWCFKVLQPATPNCVWVSISSYASVRLISRAATSPIRSRLRRKRMRSVCVLVSRNSQTQSQSKEYRSLKLITMRLVLDFYGRYVKFGGQIYSLKFIFETRNPNNMVYRAIGIMSGSALEGLDIIFAEFHISS